MRRSCCGGGAEEPCDLERVGFDLSREAPCAGPVVKNEHYIRSDAERSSIPIVSCLYSPDCVRRRGAGLAAAILSLSRCMSAKSISPSRICDVGRLPTGETDSRRAGWVNEGRCCDSTAIAYINRLDLLLSR